MSIDDIRDQSRDPSGGGRVAGDTIVAVPRDGAMPCTYQQEGLWFEHLLNPSSAAYHVPVMLDLVGTLDVDALQRALDALVARHEALRTRFDDTDGTLRQHVEPTPPQHPMTVVDLEPDELNAWTTRFVSVPMDLVRGPLLRSGVARTAPDRHRFLLVMHHMVSDGWSAGLLMNDLSRLYTAEASHTPVRLPPVGVQPVDHAAWQRDRLRSAELERQLRYWRDQLAGLPTVDFPSDRPRPVAPTGAGHTLIRWLPERAARTARDYSRRRHSSFFAVLHAALLTVLHRWTGQQDLPIGSVVSGRTRTETEQTVGYFANTLLLRAGVQGAPTFTDLVERCQDTMLDASANQDVPFWMLVDALRPERIPGRHPLFQISLTFAPEGSALADLSLGSLPATTSVPATESARFDLAIEIAESNGALRMSLEYSTELFDADRISRLFNHFVAALVQGTTQPDRRVGDLDVLSGAERHQLLSGWNSAAVATPAGLLHDVTAGHDPGATAIRFCGPDGVAALSYGALDRRANQLAHALRDAGVDRGHVVALLLERGLDLPVAQLAVLRAGGVWLPLDPRNPAARHAFQIADAGARLVLTTGDLTGLLEQVPATTRRMFLDDPDERARTAAGPSTAPDVTVQPDDPAYLIYTSGSTGAPKGVLVAHRSAHMYCHNAVTLYGMRPDDRVAQIANTVFDVTVFECFATLLSGGTLVGLPRDLVADPVALTRLLRDEQVTVAYLPPAVLATLDPDQVAGGALRVVFAAGEALPADQLARWLRPGLDLHNSYGPTEATVVCIDHHCTEAAPDPTPIGMPLPGTRAYVLDDALRPVPVGVPGQLYLAGAGLAHGYLGQPGRTAERFLADPFAPRPGGRMYVAGDLVRRRPDGVIEYLGRTDRQVKLAGQRVELGEIEYALTLHPDVRQASVQVSADGRLTAYLVPATAAGRTIDRTLVREFLADRLPVYMIPTEVVTLPELPMTGNGKLDVARLPRPDDQPATRSVAPRTETERWLAGVWDEILRRTGTSASDSFFALGGNSLQATQLIARIRDRHDLTVHPRTLFVAPVLADFAARLDAEIAGRADDGTAGEPDEAPPERADGSDDTDDEAAELAELLAQRAEIERRLAEKRKQKQQRAQRRKATQRIEPVPREHAMPCTFQQEGLWFEQLLNPMSSTYHIAFALHLHGPLVVEALEEAVHALVVRHEALRTRFLEEDGLPRQHVDPAPGRWPIRPARIDPDRAGDWVTAQVSAPMELSRGPLFRVALGWAAPEHHVLVLIIHHIVGDGWSVRLLAEELSQLYTAARTGTPHRLPAPSVQPADHATWQRRWLFGDELDRQLGFWRDTLADLPVIDFPTDRPRPAQASDAGDTFMRELPDRIGELVRDYSRTHQVSFLAVLHAALLVVLHRWTGQLDLPIGSVFSGRTRAETENTVGYFVNSLVLRTTVAGDPTFADLVRRCHATVLDATANQEIPFSTVVDQLRPERVAGRHPLFQIGLTLQPPGASVGGLRLDGIRVEPVPVEVGTSRLDLSVAVEHAPDGTLTVAVEYSTELFDCTRIERLVEHLATALRTGLEYPERPATAIEVMGTAERDDALHGWNDTGVAYTYRPLTERVAHIVATTPDATAVVCPDGTRTSYRELDRAASRLANRLRRDGVRPDTAVGVCLRRGVDMIVALLAIWKAGGAYVPLDPELPAERLEFLVGDVLPAVLLTGPGTGRLTAGLPAATAVIDLAAERSALATESDDPPRGAPGPNDTAYVLYTSGSTGAPKGVRVPHRGLDHRIQWMQDAYPIGPEDRVLQKTPYGFDVSLWEMCWPLRTGAAIVLAAPDGHRDPHYLRDLVERESVTTMHFVPTMLGTFLDTLVPDDAGRATGTVAADPTESNGLATLRRVFCSGEALPAAAARRFQAGWPGVELYNLYGPTEASIDVTAWRCRHESETETPRHGADGASVPIGHPIANHRAYVLDAWLRPVPVGVTGQLFVGGPGLAHGYHDRAALSAERFIADPWSGKGTRMYATGDLVRRRDDGAIEYLGRADRQIKLDGQRIELGEIEYTLGGYPGVHRAAVIVRDGNLAAYVVAGGSVDAAALRAHAADRLPTYMVPPVVHVLDELPVTPNGKLDIAALAGRDRPRHRRVAPRTDTERWLAATWDDLLRRENTGANDNFFEVNGNSLRATQLIARIAAHLGVHVHPRLLFANPVLCDLARELDAARDQGDRAATAPRADPGEGGPAHGGIVPFRTGGTRPPLYLVHPVGGAVTAYTQLIEQLGDDQPCYGVEDPALHGQQADDTIGDRAARYVDWIRQHRPAGPYRVGGWSLGGLLAHEMGRLLADAGAEVAVIALDSGIVTEHRDAPDVEVVAEFVIDLAATSGVTLPDVDLAPVAGLERDRLESLALDLLGGVGLAPPEMHDDLRRRMHAFAGNYRAALRHVPGCFPGPMALFTAADNPATNNPYEWLPLAPALDRRQVAGTHYSMLRSPQLAALAAELRAVLGRWAGSSTTDGDRRAR